MESLELNYEEITKKQRKNEQYLRRLEQNLKTQEQSQQKSDKMLAKIAWSVEQINNKLKW